MLPMCPHCENTVFLSWLLPTAYGNAVLIYCTSCGHVVGAVNDVAPNNPQMVWFVSALQQIAGKLGLAV